MCSIVVATNSETTAFPLPIQQPLAFEQCYQRILNLRYQKNQLEIYTKKERGRKNLIKTLNPLN